MERFNHLHLVVSPRTLHRRLEEIGSGFDRVVKQWMSDGSAFQIIGDNVDIYQKPRFMTTDHRPRMLNWFQVCAVKNRITAAGIYITRITTFIHNNNSICVCMWYKLYIYIYIYTVDDVLFCRHRSARR